MFNPVIIVAIILQAIVARSSRIAGAVIGYIITTGILLWGVTLYANGNYITFFGIGLSEPIFFIACLIWYGFDTKEFNDARKISRNAVEKSSATLPLVEKPITSPEPVEDVSAQAQQLLTEAINAYEKGTNLNIVLQKCDLAIQAAPNSAIAHNFRGNVLNDMGRQLDAAEAYREALRLDPTFAEARSNLTETVNQQ